MNGKGDILWIYLQDPRGDRPGISADWGEQELNTADPRAEGVGGIVIRIVGDTAFGWGSTGGEGGDEGIANLHILQQRSGLVSPPWKTRMMVYILYLYVTIHFVRHQ